jgi:hypothetical protein
LLFLSYVGVCRVFCQSALEIGFCHNDGNRRKTGNVEKVLGLKTIHR